MERVLKEVYLRGMCVGAIVGVALGIGTVVFTQSVLGYCNPSCREAYMQHAVRDYDWSGQIWEELADRVYEKHNMEKPDNGN